VIKKTVAKKAPAKGPEEDVAKKRRPEVEQETSPEGARRSRRQEVAVKNVVKKTIAKKRRPRIRQEVVAKKTVAKKDAARKTRPEARPQVRLKRPGQKVPRRHR